MKVTQNWLKQYVDFDWSPQELAERLTMLGLEVEEIIPAQRPFTNVITGKVESVESHPDADKLSVCQVTDGKQTFTVVCGAPNVRPEKIYPFAQVGAEIQGYSIDARKIRGVQSKGMLCSESELGLSERSAGLMELPDNTQIGINLNDFLGPKDTVFDISITPNRPDCLSVIGIAREIAGITGNPLRPPKVDTGTDDSTNTRENISVEIQAPKRCYRYSGQYIHNVIIKESPFWLAERLHHVGIRSINNVVDITNYVMMETGQPLHAFDYDLLEGRKIIVKEAEPGQKFTTLDEQEHTLDDQALMICDAERPVALAGIMGGMNSEVCPETHTVFLESAFFEPQGIRRTSGKYDLLTESSRRFERGVDPNGTNYAMQRAANLFAELADAKVSSTFIDEVAQTVEPETLTCPVKRVNSWLGTNLSQRQISDILKTIDLKCEPDGNNALNVTIPTFRFDLDRPVDLIEEVARCYGYNNIEPVMTPKINQEQQKNEFDEFQAHARQALTGMGFNETISYSLVRDKHARMFLPSEANPVALLNPISEDLAVFRPNLLLSLLSNVAYNRNRQIQDLRLYEAGHVALKPHNGSYSESNQIAGVLAGNRIEQSWCEKSVPFDFYDIKGVVEVFLQRIDVYEYALDIAKEPFWDSEAVSVSINGVYVGSLGKINKEPCAAFKIRSQDIYAFWFDFDILYQNHQVRKQYTQVPKYPSVPFDLALLIDADIPIGEIEKNIWKSGGPHLVNVQLFDFYKGEQINKDKKSVAFSLTFSSKERTLKDNEVDKIVKNILAHLKNEHSAELRPG
ncbi:MAG: phenylalanine--tRNA ligase subunit beta [candidate division KSB1 bacterium]|nr:phenylalanine--tRNA ligase subunit beta [candidate division KSB1 bacterium]